jgi:dienelactone hydrolase
VAVAIGFVPHLVKGGPLPVRVATIALGVAGLVLTIGGTVVATRGRGAWRRLGAASLVLAATGVVVLVVSPPVAATNVPRPGIAATPAGVGLDHEEVTVRTRDGVALAAWYVPSTNRSAVVLLHGAGSTRSNVLDEAAVLARAGFGVLLLDARGHGESGGRAMDFGWYGDLDVEAATAYLATRSDVDDDRIGAVGLSMGGEQALGASGSNPLLRAVVAEGATARQAADEAWLSDEYGVRGLVQERLEQVQDVVTDLLTSAGPPTPIREAVAASGRTRYLLITAGTVTDEGNAAVHVAAGAPDRVEVWTVPGAGHTGGLATAPEEWADRVTGFLTAALDDER